jgi:hypothetical protein
VPGDSVSLPLGASENAATGTLSYSATGLPAGLTLNSTTGLISGTLTAAISTSPYVVTVTVSDGTASTSESFNWNVVPLTLAAPGDQASLDDECRNYFAILNFTQLSQSSSFGSVGTGCQGGS